MSFRDEWELDTPKYRRKTKAEIIEQERNSKHPIAVWSREQAKQQKTSQQKEEMNERIISYIKSK